MGFFLHILLCLIGFFSSLLRQCHYRIKEIPAKQLAQWDGMFSEVSFVANIFWVEASQISGWFSSTIPMEPIVGVATCSDLNHKKKAAGFFP